jgi:hypothetical protein
VLPFKALVGVKVVPPAVGIVVLMAQPLHVDTAGLVVNAAGLEAIMIR